MALTTDVRHSLTAPHAGANTAHLAVAWGLYAVLAVVAIGAPLALQVPAWVVMAWLLVGNGAIAHETTHRHLFRSRHVNHLVGAVAGASVLMPWGVYRPYHLAHHRYTVAIEDPEGPPLRFGSRLEYPMLAAGGAAFLVRLHAFGVATALRRAPSWMRTTAQRRTAVLDTALCLLVAAGAVALGGRNFHAVLAAWLVPWLIAIVALVPLVLVTEHYGAAVGDADAATNTRTVISNRVVGWLYWNNNFHAAHHQLPTAVHQHLRGVDARLESPTRAEWTHRGYLAFHRSVWGTLPWFSTTARQPRHTPLP